MVVRFQMKHYHLLVFIFWFLVPVSFGIWILGASWQVAVLLNVYRYVFSLHNTWLVNSFAHAKGMRPYDADIEPRENRIVVCS